MALVDEDKQLADRRARLLLQFLNESIKITHVLFSELVDQGAEQARLSLPKLDHQIVSAAGAVNLLARAGEHALDLLVQFVAVGEDEHAGVRFVLQNPFGKEHHHDAFAAALGVPDDAALIGVDALLRRLDAEILMHTRELLHAAIEKNEIVQQLDETLLAAHLEKILVELEACVVRLVLLPLEEILLGRSDRPIAQTFGIVARENDLYRAKEPPIELRLLIREQLPNAVAYGDVTVLEFDDRRRDAVDEENEVGSPLVVAAQKSLPRQRQSRSSPALPK